MALLNDEPTLTDRLDRGWLVKEVGDAVATCVPPQVFGVHGDWGLGKTSFLHQLQLYLTGECPPQGAIQAPAGDADTAPAGVHRDHVSAVWFEAWRYQNDDVPVVALLQEIRSQLDWATKLRAKAAKLGEVTVRGALLALEDVTKKIGIQASKIEQVGEKWERDHLATVLPSHTIRAFLAEAIDKLLPEKKPDSPSPRLVVIIDDLDRCEGAAAFRLLEGLKIYLTLANCVFVLGMNQRVIEDAIGQAVPGADPSVRSRRASAYLEKLCQNVWHLPAVQRPGKLLLDWLGDDVEIGALTVSVGRVLEGAGFECLPPNPRRLKGLANLLRRMLPPLKRRMTEVLDQAVQDEEVQRLLVVAYVYQFHPDLYRRWESSPDLFDHIRDWVRGAKTELAFLNCLELPRAIVTDETTPRPTYTSRSAFPDPAESNVFWIQPLIHELGISTRAEDFAPYLRVTSDTAGQTQ